MTNPRSSYQLFLNFGEPESPAGMLKAIVLAAFLLIFAHFIAAIGAAVYSPYSEGLGPELKAFIHFLLKLGLLPIVLMLTVMKYQREYPRSIEHAVKIFALFLVAYAVYCIFQRYTGVNWVKGFEATLPENRLDNGVFRISGFMGHPLSLAYNLVLVIIFFLSALKSRMLQGKKFYLWLGLASAATILFASGSRLPTLLAIFSIGAVFFEFSKKRLLLLSGSMLLIFAALFADPNFRGRSTEILKSDWSQKLDDRNFFWSAHLKMFEENQIFGVGLSGYEAAKAHYYGIIGYHAKIYSAHNIYLQYLGDSGLVGFLGLAFFLIFFAVVAGRLARHQKQNFLAAFFLVTVLSGLMQNTPRDSEYLYALWFCMVLFFVMADFSEKQSVNGVGLKDDRGHTKQQPSYHQPGAGKPHSASLK